MTLRLWALACVAAWTVAVLVSNPLFAQASTAGWERFEFVGNAEFSDEQLRSALIAEPDFLLATHPHSDRSSVRAVAERLLVAGYRNSGFQSPKVEFKSNVDGGGVVSIDEGPRLRCGPIRILNANKMSADQLAERLTGPSAKKDSFPTFVELQGETITRWVDSKGKVSSPEPPVWEVGSFVKFDSENKLSKKVVSALKDFGFSAARTQVTIKPSDVDLTAELVVDILEEGPSDVAEVLHVAGTQANSPHDVLTFLGLRPGVAVDQALVQSITKQLWDCGRFKKHNVHFDHDANGRGRLNIELADVKGVPSLAEPLSEAAIVFGRARSWLNSLNDRDEDVSVTFRESGLECEVVHSRQGLIVQLRINDGAQVKSDPRPEVNLSLMFDDSSVTFVNSENMSLWQADVSKFDGKVRLETNFAAAEEDDKFSRLNLSGSCNSKRMADELAFMSTLYMCPADWSGFAYKSDLQTSVADGKLTAARGTDRLEIDVTTGQIYHWDSEVASLRIEASQFSQLKSQIDRRGVGKKNDYEPEKPVTSLLGHLLSPQNWSGFRDVWQLHYADQRPRDPSLSTAVTKLVAGELLRPLDAFAVHVANDHANDDFEIPDAHPENVGLTKMAIRMVGKYGLKCAPELFAEGTWPMSVLREACLVMVERGKYSGGVLKELQADDSNGPLCDASVAYLLSLAQQPIASTFAQRSLERLNPASLQSDLEVLVSGPSGRWMASLVAACESLSDKEIESLRAIGLSHQIVAGLYAIQGQSDGGDESYWYDVAKTGLEGVLSGIVQR